MDDTQIHQFHIPIMERRTRQLHTIHKELICAYLQGLSKELLGKEIKSAIYKPQGAK